MPQIILYPSPTGRVVTVTPSPGVDLADIVGAVPEGLPHRIIDTADLPAATEWLWAADGPILPAPASVEEMLARLKSARDAAIAAGIEVNGVHVQTDDLSQQRLTSAALAAQIDPGTPVLWKTATGEFVALTAPEVIALALAARNHVQACFNREAELAALIRTADDPAAVAISF